MRGQHLFSSLFELPPLPEKTPGKGRNESLDAQRNELLLYRYYYYGTFTGLRYSIAIQNLRNEFFLTERRIQDIMQEQAVLMRKIREQAPGLNELKAKWPHLVWK